jgi:hypothetical protein
MRLEAQEQLDLTTEECKKYGGDWVLQWALFRYPVWMNSGFGDSVVWSIRVDCACLKVRSQVWGKKSLLGVKRLKRFQA